MSFKFSNWNKPTPITPKVVGNILAGLATILAGSAGYAGYPIVALACLVFGVAAFLLKNIYGYEDNNTPCDHSDPGSPARAEELQ